MGPLLMLNCINYIDCITIPEGGSNVLSPISQVDAIASCLDTSWLLRYYYITTGFLYASCPTQDSRTQQGRVHWLKCQWNIWNGAPKCSFSSQLVCSTVLNDTKMTWTRTLETINLLLRFQEWPGTRMTRGTYILKNLDLLGANWHELHLKITWLTYNTTARSDSLFEVIQFFTNLNSIRLRRTLNMTELTQQM